LNLLQDNAVLLLLLAKRLHQLNYQAITDLTDGNAGREEGIWGGWVESRCGIQKCVTNLKVEGK